MKSRVREKNGRYAQSDAPIALHVVSVRLTKDEHAHVKEQAAAAGLSLSEYIRRRTLGHTVRSRESLMLINELRRQGGLLKHLFSLNGYTESAEAAAAFRAIQRAIEQHAGSTE